MPKKRRRTSALVSDRETVKLVLRMPADVHREIAEAAENQTPPVSINHMILTLLYLGIRMHTRMTERQADALNQMLLKRA